MKKIIAIVLCFLVACTAFACLVSAEGEATTKDPYETDIPQLITNLVGGRSVDYSNEIHNGLKFFRILTENMLKFAQDCAAAFDRTVDWLQSFSLSNLFSGLLNR